jgi:hypothetical protein
MLEEDPGTGSAGSCQAASATNAVRCAPIELALKGSGRIGTRTEANVSAMLHVLQKLGVIKARQNTVFMRGFANSLFSIFRV